MYFYIIHILNVYHDLCIALKKTLQPSNHTEIGICMKLKCSTSPSAAKLRIVALWIVPSRHEVVMELMIDFSLSKLMGFPCWNIRVDSGRLEILRYYLEFSKMLKPLIVLIENPWTENPLWNQRSDCSGLAISFWRLNQSEEAEPAQLSIAGTGTSHSTEKLRVWYFE